MRRHKAPTQGWQLAPLASELALWGSKNPGVILIEGTVSIYSQRGSKVTFITYQSQKWLCGAGNAMIEIEIEREVDK